MSELIVIGYDDPAVAQKAFKAVQKLEKDKAADLTGLAVVRVDEDGETHVDTPRRDERVARSATAGALWALVFGILFATSGLGLVGAALGGLYGKLRTKPRQHISQEGPVPPEARLRGPRDHGFAGHRGQAQRGAAGIRRHPPQDFTRREGREGTRRAASRHRVGHTPGSPPTGPHSPCGLPPTRCGSWSLTCWTRTSASAGCGTGCRRPWGSGPRCTGTAVKSRSRRRDRADRTAHSAARRVCRRPR